MLASNLSAYLSPLKTPFQIFLTKKFMINSQRGLTLIKAQVNLLKDNYLNWKRRLLLDV